MADIEIRRAVAGDVEGFVASSSALFAEDAGPRDGTVDLDWPRKHGAERFNATAGDSKRLTLVAVDGGGAVVGHLTGLLNEATAMRPVRVASLLSMYVRPEHRRAGVGTRLVAEFRSWARRHHMDLIEVMAYASNDAALCFYQRTGFAAQSVVLEAKP